MIILFHQWCFCRFFFCLCFRQNENVCVNLQSVNIQFSLESPMFKGVQLSILMNRKLKLWELNRPTVFFFSSRRRHTSSLRDWSSDVCSSDLIRTSRLTPLFPTPGAPPVPVMSGKRAFLDLLKQEGVEIVFGNPGTTELPLMDAFAEIGRASCRERV